MRAIIEEHYKEVTLKNNARQISSIKTDAVMISAHNTSHYADMTGDAAFLSSEILSFEIL
jgi:cellobiose phosphorylase